MAKPKTKSAPPAKMSAGRKAEAKAEAKAHPYVAIVRGVEEAFLASPPAGSETGLWTPARDDALANPTLPFAIGDGSYRLKDSDWTFSFAGGRLIQATHSHRRTLLPGKVEEI